MTRSDPGADVKVDGLHQPGHRPHQEGAHPRCAQVLDGRDELTPAEGLGPVIEALGDVVPRELVKDGGRFRSEHQGDGVERVILGQHDGDQLKAKLA